MDAVCPRQQVKERTVRIVSQINSLLRQLPQSEQLRCEETGSDSDCHSQPMRVALTVLALQGAARDFKRPGACENQASAQPQQRRNVNALQVQGRLRALMV